MSNNVDTTKEINVIEFALDRLAKQGDLSFLEQYAMYMGKAQILEMGLKGVLIRKFNYEEETIDRWTLGRIANELKENNIREDFTAFLDGVVEYRNYVAHEILADDALIKSLTNGKGMTKPSRMLSKAAIELEQLMIMYDLCQEHDTWHIVLKNLNLLA